MYQSVMLAQLLGIFLTVMGLGMLLNKQHMREVAANIPSNPGAQFAATLVPLLFGTYLVVAHNYWIAGWPVLVTIVGWFIFLVGVFRALFPAFWLARVKQFGHGVPNAVGTVGLIIGLILVYFGFFA